MDNDDIRLIGLVVILLVGLVVSGQLNNFIRGIRNKIRKWKKEV